MAFWLTGDPPSADDDLYYIHSDHLGSTTLLTDQNGNQVGDRVRYYPYGEYRSAPTVELVDRGYTGHRENRGLGLIYMNARYYVVYINRFLTADTIVPDPAAPRSFNRYTYSMNNPIYYTDPSGHCVVEFAEASECTPPGILPTPYPGLPSVDPEASFEFSPPFNLDTATITSEHRKGGHIGTDYAVDAGTTAHASTIGLVVITDWCTLDNCVDQQGNTSADANGGYGNLIIVEYGYSSLPEEVRDAYDLEEGESLYVLYGHMSSIHSRRGNVVHSSVGIGKTGSTGHSSGPHLHAEFRTGPSGQLWGSALCTTECRSASEVTPWEVWRDDLAPVDPVDAWE